MTDWKSHVFRSPRRSARALWEIQKNAVLMFWRAYWRFVAVDGWAIASHVALTSLMAIFPFLIFVTAVAGLLDLQSAASKAAELTFSIWPSDVAAPIAREVKKVLTVPRRDYLAFGIALSLYLASNGVEALRIGLNRSYGVKENRYWLLTRLESIGFVVVGGLAMTTLGFLVILGPVIWTTLVSYFDWLAPFTTYVYALKWAIEIIVLSIALLIAHFWLPAGRRRLKSVMPGVLFTLVAWLTGGAMFAAYLADFANYASTYAGLASVMTAIVFLYLIAAILVFGGTLNHTWAQMNGTSLGPRDEGDGKDHNRDAEHLDQ